MVRKIRGVGELAQLLVESQQLHHLLPKRRRRRHLLLELVEIYI